MSNMSKESSKLAVLDIQSANGTESQGLVDLGCVHERVESPESLGMSSGVVPVVEHGLKHVHRHQITHSFVASLGSHACEFHCVQA